MDLFKDHFQQGAMQVDPNLMDMSFNDPELAMKDYTLRLAGAVDTGNAEINRARDLLLSGQIALSLRIDRRGSFSYSPEDKPWFVDAQADIPGIPGTGQVTVGFQTNKPSANNMPIRLSPEDAVSVALQGLEEQNKMYVANR